MTTSELPLMNTSQTQGAENREVIQTSPDLTDEETNRILSVLIFGVIPTISLLGIVGNVFSILILSKHGLTKCSNILLFSLAISDICFLIGLNSIAKMFYEFGQVQGFAMSYTSAYFMFILYNVFHIMDYGGGSISFNIPLLITIERLVAVYLPLKFPFIVTPKRTASVVICIYVFWISMTTYTAWLQFDYNNDNPYNISVGVLQRSALFYNHPQVSAVLQALFIYLGPSLPLPFVIVGCIFIGVKVKLASKKRLKLTSQSSSAATTSAVAGTASTTTSKDNQRDKKVSDTSRTTRTLVSVCAVYSVACLILNIPQHFPQLLSYNLFTDKPSNLAQVVYQVMNLVVCINSSCNFLIYVITNKKFRDTQKEILTSCFTRHSLNTKK